MAVLAIVVWWLVLAVGGNSGLDLLHVGTYSSLAECQDAVQTVWAAGPVASRYYTCVRANDAGVNPPK
jgi:hypothetical protein